MQRLLLLIAVFLLMGCAARAELGEEVALKVGELASVTDADMLIRVDSIGRDITEDGEISYVIVMVEVDGEEYTHELTFSDDLEIGDYTVEMQSIDPFGDPPECSLVVSRH